jgi:metal-responsive CopG/Arc/MetJ family transcriptional regulator
MPRPKKTPAKAAPPRPAVTFKLPRELLEQIDALARREERNRSQVIEFACREYVQKHQRRPAAA